MPSHPAAIPPSNRTLVRLGDLIRAERARRRSRWRRLEPCHQALLVLAHLGGRRHPRRLAAGFGISSSTAWRYVREAVDLLASLSNDVHAADERTTRPACAILDGTLVPIDRVADQKPYYSGNTDARASASGSSPTRPGDWCGHRRRCPAPSTT